MKIKQPSRLALTALAAAALSCIAQHAAAENSNELPTVMVTATRVSSGLLQTPVAVTAVTQEKLTREGITDVRGLSGSVPNMQISTGADSGVQISIRGVSSNNFTEIGDPAVGLHVGGLYSPRPQGAMALMFDLEQVEVLRGPQGTLFGRNSTAGSINIIPAKPEFGETYGNAEVDFGNYNKRQFNLVQNIGISDKFAIRATLSKITRDGWINQSQDFTDVYDPVHGLQPDGIPDVDQRRNSKVGKKDYYYNKNEWAGRITARAKFSNDIEGSLSYEKFQNSGAGELAMKDCDQAAGTAYACTGGKWDAKVNVPGKIDMSIDTVRGGLTWNLNKSSTLEYNFAYADQRRSQQTDDDAGYHPLASQINVHLPVSSADEQWGMWPIADNSSNTVDSKYISTVHELQFKQKTDTLQYVLGAFWMHEKNQINYAQDMLMTAPYGLPASAYYAQANRPVDSKALFAQADWKFAPTWTATLGGRYSWDKKTDIGGRNYGTYNTYDGAYYNGHYDPGHPGEAGFRPHSSKDLTKDMGAFAGVGAYAGYGEPAHNDHTESWKKFTYRLGLMKQLTPKDMVYTSLATGYKAGGFGDKDAFCTEHSCEGQYANKTTFLPYKPETVTNLELGYKGLMLENRLSLSATAFYSKYKDMQVTGEAFMTKFKPDAPCPSENPGCDIHKTWQTVNVGVVDIAGLELEVDYKPWAGARLGGFFSYLSTKMKDYPSYSDNWLCDYRGEMGAPACPPTYSGSDPTLDGRNVYDITGNQLPLAPKFSFGVSFSQDFNFGGGYKLTPWVNVKWQDKMYFTLRNLDNAHISDAQAAFTKIDASIKLVSPKQWHIEAYVLNLGNKVTKNSLMAGDGWVKATWNDPRMFGVRVGVEY
ncbi:TonB-dependent receptor [Roseateles oligotrophus]|uniref:TonB-dependent receptor n=1 Tax=Roseateles oligotrophus TaxID=1769250 RepID=A0ABT2Y9U5_9BURK|nr:TonB-dependent receptor [Roseateles oligotrophus]MCV2367071.1 TonB-dependent receptor [Roseateles oligotrophus]